MIRRDSTGWQRGLVIVQDWEKLIPPKNLSLEQCLEFCRSDECVEGTPAAVRICKVVLDAGERAKTAAPNRRGSQ